MTTHPRAIETADTRYILGNEARAAYFSGRYANAVPLLEKLIALNEEVARTCADWRAIDRWREWLNHSRAHARHAVKVAA